MISRIIVAPKVIDKRGQSLTVQSYLLDHKFNKSVLNKIVAALTNPVIETSYLDEFPGLNFTYAIEVGYKPGVTDNVAHSVKETITDLVGRSSKFEVYSSRIYVTNFKNEAEAGKFVGTLYNPLIERANIIKLKDSKFILPAKTPKVILEKRVPVIKVSLDLTDEELVKIGKEGIVDPNGSRRGPLALDLASLKAIKEHFDKLKREPTDIELESLAQTWSEHCKHTIFANPIDDITNGLYKTYIKGATNLIREQKGKLDFCVSVFSDNAGGIIFDENYLITHKVETHNAPSSLDPFGGAITGIVGVNRDCIGFGLGAKPVANVYGFCLGRPEDTRPLYLDKDSAREMLPPARIMDGVIKGINSGGNCSGIPTPSGFIKFDDRYRGRPLVFAGTVGLIPRKIGNRLSHEKKAKNGDYIVMVGGRVGADGIHGATFSSVAMDSSSPATAVQIGDPITQKKLSDAIVKEARDQNLYNSITDDGAGGLSCSVAEMAKESGGAEVDLEKVPLKYPGLQPWEIWISESQERMTLAIPRSKWQKFRKLMEKRGVEATIIGKFTNSGKCVVNWNGKKIMDLDMEFLHNGLPKHQLHTSPGPKDSWATLSLSRRGAGGEVLTKDLEKLLGGKNIAGYSFISEQYDHEVQATSVLKPLAGRGRINTDAQIFRPVLSSEKGVVLSSATYPSYGDISMHSMAACAIDTAIRNIVCAGGTLSHLALLDNFCWCSSNDPTRLGQLVDAVKACYEYAVGYGTPFISGKDSMFNDFKGYDEKGNSVEISIPPTLLISAIGVVENIYKTISPEFKNIGDEIYLLGETHNELVPKVDYKKNTKTYLALEDVIQKELINSAMSVNSGGLGVALAKACVGGMVGCNVSIKSLPGDAKSSENKLFSESQGRILVSISPKNVSKFEKMMREVPYAKLGKVAKADLIISDNKKVIETSVKKLYKIYHSFSDSMQ